MTLDDVSGGRLTLGIGAGGTGFDAEVLGEQPWSQKERTDRFAEFLELLDRLLTEGDSSFSGTFYSAAEARNVPGCVQSPRLPFAVAAVGPRATRLAARYGQAWVTTGDPSVFEEGTPEQSLAAIRAQVERVSAAVAAEGRDPAAMTKIFLTGFTPDYAKPFTSVDAFVDFAGQHAEAGIDEIVLHWPVADTIFGHDPDVFEQIATEAPAQLS